jgi:GntR family transcriptional regulator
VIITLSPSGASPVDQVSDQIRGLVTTGQLASGERLPSVRQLASDLGLAPGTVAKAYKGLEAEGVLETRTGSGTRVARTASASARPVVEAARRLATASQREGTDLDEAIRVLRAIW